MNCKYCKQPCISLTPVYYENGDLAHKRMYCNLCPIRIEYYINPNAIIDDIQFRWEESNKRYRIFCDIKNNACLIQFQIYKKEWNVDEIDLDFLPVWNPKTIKEKVKLYIRFS